MHQEAIGPDLSDLLSAAERERPSARARAILPRPPPDDRFNIPTAHHINAGGQPPRSSSEEAQECRRFPPSYTPSDQGSPFLPRTDPPAPVANQAPPYVDRAHAPLPPQPPDWDRLVPVQPQPNQDPFFQPPPHPQYPPGGYVPNPLQPSPYQDPYGQPQPVGYGQNVQHPAQDPYGQPLPIGYGQNVQQPAQPPYYQPVQHHQFPAGQPAIAPQGPYVVVQNPSNGVPQQPHHQVQMQPGPPAFHPPVGPYVQVHPAFQAQPVQPVVQGAVQRITYGIAPINSDLAKNPQYHCVQGKMEERGDGCFASCCMSLDKGSYKTSESCLPPLVPRRAEVPTDSPYLHRAFVTGWAMLSSVIFPLVPSHGLRCLWVLAELLFACTAYAMSYSVGAFAEKDALVSGIKSPHLIARNVLGIFAGIFALIDMICCLVVLVKQCINRQTDRNANPEARLLIQRERYRNRGLSGCISRSNDIFRLLITEMFLYGFLICSLPLTADELHIRPVDVNAGNETIPHPHHLAHLKFATFIVMLLGFVFLVYVVQLLPLVRLLRFGARLSMGSLARRKIVSLFAHVILQYFAQRLIQIVMLITFVYAQINSHTEHGGIDHHLLDLIFLAYCIPIVTLITTPALYYGWVEDASIAYCMDYLQGLDKLRTTPETSQATKDEIERILNFYDYETTSVEVPRVLKRNISRSVLHPLQSPVTSLLCLPSLALLAIYFYRLFGDVTEPALVYTQLVGFLLIDAHLVFVFLCIVIFVPAAVVALVWRVYRRRHGHMIVNED